MLDGGEIILDIAGKERDSMTKEDLIKMYSAKRQKDFDNDRILLADEKE